MTPILLIGAGRMGGALIEGWLAAGAFSAHDMMVRDPSGAEALAVQGVRVNPPDADLAQAGTVLLAVKPQIWREAAAAIAPHLSRDAIIISIAAGVGANAISQAFGGLAVARVMPTTAVAIRRGTASIFAQDPDARARAHALFAPVATVADLDDEALMHAATAVSGSGPAYLYAFVEALEAAAISVGLEPEVAAKLARSTVTGAAALLEQGGEPAELRRQVTSPGGTTQAALNILLSEDGLMPIMARAVEAAADRSRELGG
jgi:pyrroline-5-carboxylate reductase